jgi:hypothetical protein
MGITLKVERKDAPGSVRLCLEGILGSNPEPLLASHIRVRFQSHSHQGPVWL